MTPRRPGTSTTTFRLDPALLAAAKVKATTRGETVTEVVRRALRVYVSDDETPYVTVVDSETFTKMLEP